MGLKTNLSAVFSAKRPATIGFLDDERAEVWWILSAVALTAAVLFVPGMTAETLWRPLFSLFMALLAGMTGLFAGLFTGAVGGAFAGAGRGRRQGPSGLSSFWLAMFSVPAAFSGSVGVHLGPENLSAGVLALIALALGLTAKGPRWLFSILQAALLVVAVLAVSPEASALAVGFVGAAFPIATALYLLREARAENGNRVLRLREGRDRLASHCAKIADLVDSADLARERSLGPTARGYHYTVAGGGSDADARAGNDLAGCTGWNDRPSFSLETLVCEARKTLLSFQSFQKAGSQKATTGLVRYVFFPPVTGTEMDNVVVGEIATLIEGLKTCLSIALESLPDPGPRRDRREGVVRLSIRVGLRVVEIAVEDNGRGTLSVVGATELERNLAGLRRFAELNGGKLERFARLGVGARTVVELPLAQRDIRQFISSDSTIPSEAATENAPLV